jgi:RNA polymerase sigma-70 factor (ECF subfamily)
LTEQNLIAGLRKKDEGAFKEAFNLYSGMILNTSLGILHNTEEAEDMVQEVMIEVLNSVHGFKGQSTLKTWIYRLTISKSLDLLRAKKRQKRGGMFTFIRLKNDESWMHQPDFNHPGALLENKQRAAVLFKAIGELPEKQKVAFTLHKLENRNHKEIAEIMETSVSSVESLMHRAKKNLQKLLKDFYEMDKR